MSSFLDELGGITAGVGAEGLAFAAGFAASHALTPEADLIGQASWHAAQVRRLEAMIAAQAAAEALADEATMADEASYSGVDATRFAYLYQLALTAPGSGQLLEMLRHGTIQPGDFTHGLRKAKLEGRWDDALAELQTQRLNPAQLALGVVRSTVNDPGLLVVTLDTEGSTITPYPQWPGDTLEEFAAGGIDKDRARVLVGSVGLPMSPQQAASATFRKIINRQAFNLSILEGDIRPEYADAIFQQAAQILSADQYTELQLRGFSDRAARLLDTDKHGMSIEDSDKLFDVLGRAPSTHTVVIGLARGGKYPGSYANVPEPYRSEIQRSNIREEWCEIVYASRYNYPSPFVLRSLAQAGTLGGETDVEQTLLEIGWKPDLAKKAAVDWTAATTTGDPNVKKAHTKAWTEAQTSYINEESTAADLAPIFTLLGVAPAAQTEVLAAWDAIRALNRKQLSPAQIVKAVKGNVTNPTTGAPWTQAEGLAALQARGYDQADATTLLNE